MYTLGLLVEVCLFAETRKAHSDTDSRTAIPVLSEAMKLSPFRLFSFRDGMLIEHHLIDRLETKPISLGLSRFALCGCETRLVDTRHDKTLSYHQR